MPGGVLTIGLETSDPQQNEIISLLPLARLQHYGAPIKSSCLVNSNERVRLTLNEFLQAVSGCFLQGQGDAGSILR